MLLTEHLFSSYYCWGLWFTLYYLKNVSPDDCPDTADNAVEDADEEDDPAEHIQIQPCQLRERYET